MPYEPTIDGVAIFESATDIGLTQSQLSQLSGVSTAILSRAINGSRDLSYLEFRALKDVVDICGEIVRRAAPVPVDFTDIRAIRDLIQRIRTERQNPPSALTDAESNLLKRFAAGEPLADLAFSERLSPTDLLSRIEVLLRRTQTIAANRFQEVVSAE